METTEVKINNLLEEIKKENSEVERICAVSKEGLVIASLPPLEDDSQFAAYSVSLFEPLNKELANLNLGDAKLILTEAANNYLIVLEGEKAIISCKAKKGVALGFLLYDLKEFLKEIESIV